MTRSGRALLLGSLYLAQGLPYGFYTQALPVLLRDQGYGLARVTALTSLLAAPWALKFLWAPWVDRPSRSPLGRRRTWILAMQGLSTLLLLALAALDLGHQTNLILAILLLVNLACATQDIATDALAVALVPEEERGLTNGLQVAGYRVGMVLAGGALLSVYGRLGWTGTLLILAGLTALASLPILRTAEPPAALAAAPGSPLRSLLQALRQAGAPAWFGLLALYKFGESLGVSVVRLELLGRGYTIEDLAWIFGTVGFAAGLTGALAGGALVGPLGRTRSLWLLGGLQALAVGSYALLPLLSRDGVTALVAIEHGTSGMATAALFTRMMDACRPGEEGSDYTLQASVVVLATGAAAAVSGWSLEQLGPVAHFLLAGGLGLLALLPAAKVRPPGA